MRQTTAEKQHHLVAAATEVGGLKAAVDVLQARMAWEETEVALGREFNCFPWDGAIALMKAMEAVFGFAMAVDTPGFFGSTPPKFVAVECGPGGEKKNVLWGRVQIPGAEEGFLQCGATLSNNGLAKFVLSGKYKQKYSPKIDRVVEDMEKQIAVDSIYKNRFVRLEFYDERGQYRPMPVAVFPTLQVPSVLEFSTELQQAISEEVFVPLRHFERLLSLGAKSKRGILLDGPPGVGKTLLMTAAAVEGVKNGWTVMQVKNAQEFLVALRYVQMTPPLKKCVIQVEDIDRTMSGARSEEMDLVLNALDGVDTKNCHLMVMMTTNNRESINATALRVERLDSIFRIEAPDAATAARILEKYAKGKLAVGCDTAPAGKLLEGQIPAAIRDCVDRATYAALWREPGGDLKFTTEDLVSAARRVVEQDKLRNKGQTIEAPTQRVLLQTGRNGIFQTVFDAEGNEVKV